VPAASSDYGKKEIGTISSFLIAQASDPLVRIHICNALNSIRILHEDLGPTGNSLCSRTS